MGLLEFVAILMAGVGAGTINTIVGSGSLITFPTLLFFGVPPVVANMSNTVGLMPGGISGMIGYRRELTGLLFWAKRLVPASVLGGAVGATLLLVLPPSVFEAVVPALVGLGVVLVVTGPKLQRWVAARNAASSQDESSGYHGTHHPVLLWLLVFLTAIYGGYFGAAQGVILIGVLNVLLAAPLQHLNAVKNALGFAANTIAAAVFITVRSADVDWMVALTIGIGTLIGGFLGAGVGRRLPPLVLRGVIVVVGVLAIIYLLGT
ncbi:MAG: sulfite exporter TauE/SafE family protein [Dermatophilus congolensis]|nr:sulfite exporter TauE/SafE family protein [Dermatophilus congolensis]